jgi:hypothetical protein
MSVELSFILPPGDDDFYRKLMIVKKDLVQLKIYFLIIHQLDTQILVTTLTY